MSGVRIAVIGAGNWGRNHVRTVASIATADLVAVCDESRERQREIADQYPGVAVTGSVDEAMRHADGVVVATPAATHAAIALQAIDRGIPVLIEKPMTLSTADAMMIAERAAAKGVSVLVGHLLLFHPVITRLSAMVDQGDLGELFYVYSQRVNLGQVRPDENALWSFGPHDISIALQLLGGTPQAVSAHGRCFIQPGVEDVVFLTLEFATGAMFHAQMSWLDPHKERRITVVGSQKMAVFDDMQVREKLKVYDKGVERPPTYGSYGESLAIREGDILVPRVPNQEPLRLQLEHFLAVVRGEESPRVDAQNGVAVVRVLAAATESMRQEGRMIPMQSVGVGT